MERLFSNDLIRPDLHAIELVVRSASVYLFILILLRLGGKRQIAQMSPTDFVAILLISNAVQNAMNGGDNSLPGGMILAATLVALSRGISALTYRNRAFRRLFEGTPTLLIHRGELIADHLRTERITPQEVKAMLRRQGIHHVQEVQTAVLEPDGTFSVTKVGEPALPV